MSKRTERRAAERLQHKLRALELRQGQQKQQPQQEQQPQQQREDETPAPVNIPNPEPPAANTRELNALKHGSCSHTLLLPSEDMDEFIALEKRWFKAYNISASDPERAYVAALIRTAVQAEWFYIRADRNYSAVERQFHIDQPDVRHWTDSQHHAIQRFMRYRTAHANSLARHRKALEDFLKARLAENVAKSRVDIARERLKIHQAKNAPPKTLEETLADMTEQAIRLGYRKPNPPASPQP